MRPVFLLVRRKNLRQLDGLHFISDSLNHNLQNIFCKEYAYKLYCCLRSNFPQKFHTREIPFVNSAFGSSFSLQRIIRQSPSFCVIIFLYLKHGRGRPLFARIYAATTLGIDGRMIDVEVDVSPGLLGFEFVGDSTLGETVMSLTFHIL